MSRNLQSPTKLTEFAPLQPEEKQQGVSQLFTRIFNLAKPSKSTDLSPNTSENVEEASNNCEESTDNTNRLVGSIKDSLSGIYSVDIAEGRSLPNVLKRISNLLALKSTNLQSYCDTELKQYWMPDSVSRECYECCEKFTTFRRRHHCRVCGQIFCSQCCNQQIPGKIFGCSGDLRVCTYCCKIVLAYLKSPDVGAELTADLRALQEDLQSKYGVTSGSDSLSNNISISNTLDVGDASTARRKISVGYQEEKFAVGRMQTTSYLTTEERCRALQNSSSLRNLFEEICKPTSGISLQTIRYRLKNYTNCFPGSELVDWMIAQRKANTRVQAVAICQALVEAGYFENLSDSSGSFNDDYSLYKPMMISSPETMQGKKLFELQTGDEPSWVQNIQQDGGNADPLSDADIIGKTPRGNMNRLKSSSSFLLDLNLEENTVHLSKHHLPQTPEENEKDDCNSKHLAECKEALIVKTSEQRELVPESGWHNASQLRTDNGENVAYALLTEAFQQHETNLLNQLLNDIGLPSSWADIVTPLTHKIVDAIRPDMMHDAVDIDIRQYVRFKKVPGGSRANCRLVEGIVCSKNVAHRNMVTDLENPSILLLQCSVVYQRTEGRFMSLDPILMQEKEYLRHAANRIVALQPRIVLVHRNVSGFAQDLLREAGITLVLNVKLSVLERLARCTQADIVTSLDAHIGRPRLASCKRFFLKTFDAEDGKCKTLMFFEGLPQPQLGATVLLRGSSSIGELEKLKKVIMTLTFACYNWRLEKSFLMDEFAQPPNPKDDEFFNESKETSPDLEETQKLTEICPKIPVPAGGEVAADFKKTSVADDKRVSAQSISDCSDPLRAYQEGTEDPFTSSGSQTTFTVAELPFTNKFRKALDDTSLSISPYLMFTVPYLETENGRKCTLRKFFPNTIYYSKYFETKPKNSKNEKNSSNVEFKKNAENMNNVHPFVTAGFHNSADNKEVQNLLANFRACGSRYPLRKLCHPSNDTTKKEKGELNDAVALNDALDMENHQRLAVLFCSFSHQSNNAPAFCVHPFVVHMDFYRRDDIPLGCFLERYCFRESYVCPSETCDTPMIKHIRRFVHNSGCVSVSLNTIENQSKDDQIIMWSWCSKCLEVSPAVPMSADTWSFSFAKYLELKFHGNIYYRRGNKSCKHSLHHDHCQYFSYKNIVASFKYTNIQLWEVSLPPPIIHIQYNITSQQNEMIDEVKSIALRGHEIYSTILEKLSIIVVDDENVTTALKQQLQKDQSIFRQKIEEIQLKLTSPTVENKSITDASATDATTTVEQQNALWSIQDNLMRIKHFIVETVDAWNVRLGDAVKKRDADKRKDSKSTETNEPPGTPEITKSSDNKIANSDESGEGNPVSGPIVPISAGGTKKNRSLDQSEDEESANYSPKGHNRSQSDGPLLSQQEDSKKEVDKKSSNTILSKLLPSKVSAALIHLPIQLPFSSQEHYIFAPSIGIPIIVYENEPSSLISYALNSNDYKKSLEELLAKKSLSGNSDQCPSPIHKRKVMSDKERPENAELNSSIERNSGILSFLRSNHPKTELVSSITSSDLEINSSFEDSVTDDAKKNKSIHIDVQFQDSSCDFFCTVFYAERFMWLRKTVFPCGEDAYIRSLARSVRWNARGGKSGSTFCKTKDDRFILKEMSKLEMQIFLDSAPNYFAYMEHCQKTSQPTLLGKIVGVYQVKISTSSATLKMILLVMENLFYNRSVTHKFDLKGSMRNRLVNPDNQDEDLVLLDENLMKMTCESPLYILPHSKAVLTAAIQNDTQFLALQSVMDYSLLVGLDSENKELVLGIIDYIRTFTWDKKIETMVKKTGILGGQGKQPTIVSPEEYRTRFIVAMHQYFLQVPDRWAGLGRGIEC